MMYIKAYLFGNCIVHDFLFLKQTTYKGLKNTLVNISKNANPEIGSFYLRKGELAGLEPSLGQRGAWGYFFLLILQICNILKECCLQPLVSL